VPLRGGKFAKLVALLLYPCIILCILAIAVIGSAVVMLKQSKTKEGVTDDD